jgi:hypothetical protein
MQRCRYMRVFCGPLGRAQRWIKQGNPWGLGGWFWVGLGEEVGGVGGAGLVGSIGLGRSARGGVGVKSVRGVIQKNMN